VYEATVLGLLMLVREFTDGQRTTLIVGHNPGLAELAVGLAAPPPDPPAGFPTAAIAVFGLPGPWESVTPGEARLLDFAVPADMRREDLSGTGGGYSPRRGRSRLEHGSSHRATLRPLSSFPRESKSRGPGASPWPEFSLAVASSWPWPPWLEFSLGRGFPWPCSPWPWLPDAGRGYAGPIFRFKGIFPRAAAAPVGGFP
jgi:hypothetical protein